MKDFLTVIHECADYPAWRRVYDADAPRRAAAGLGEYHVLREHSNPNVVALMFEIDDRAQADAMMNSPELADRMKQAGIKSKPVVRFRRGQYYRVDAASYATMSLDVKDFDVAMRAYGMDVGQRKAATLTDIGVLRLADDCRNLLLMWTVDDVALATAFFDSAALKVHMVESAGVVGTPERHFWMR